MKGHGLLGLLEEDKSLPLEVAPGHLRRALEEIAEAPLEIAAQQPGGWYLLRLEVPVAVPRSKEPLVLDWLAAQQDKPRVLFAARDGTLLLAGAGAAHVHRDSPGEEEGADEQLPALSSMTHERLRYVGGVRFDAFDARARASGEEWQPFGRCFWALPRVELLICGSLHAANRSLVSETSSDAASSCASTSSLRAPSGRDRCPSSEAVLAVQLRWHCDALGAWQAERRRAVEALLRLRSCRGAADGPTSFPGSTIRCDEAVPREEFEEQVRKAVEAFRAGSLRKVVLARRRQMRLMHRMDPVEVLRQVAGESRKRTYLFLLEVADGAAYVSLSPERLCKVQGLDLWTEAVAGTWPIAEFAKIGEAALLASSEKNSSEHQVVVDYICELLGRVSKHVKVCDTHILKLKHLVHIKQSYHAIADDGGTNGDHKPASLAKFFCKHMSPTPAVGGLPLAAAQDFIREAERWDRGLYAAPCGLYGAQSSELLVAIRSALLRDGRELYVYAGAGIVLGSDPSEEYAEISLKMRQFADSFPMAPPEAQTPVARIAALAAMPNMNTLWAWLIVEEFVRSGVANFVICPGSRSTPLVVAVMRHSRTAFKVNHDERGAAFFALGWAKALSAPVAVIVTSGTAVANLLPGVVEAAQSKVPLVLLTADRPAELRDTGANQTITQPGIFGAYTRWAKDFPCPSEDYPAHALLGDVDLAAAHAAGRLGQHPGPVHLNFCFRENLAPDAGAIRGAPGRTSAWSKTYVDTREMYAWVDGTLPRSSYVPAQPSLLQSEVVHRLAAVARRGDARIVVLVGTLHRAEDVLLAEDVAMRLRAAIFADITSGLRQRANTVHFADQLLNCDLLSGDLLQLHAVVHLGGPVCSKRLNDFTKVAGPQLYVRVTPSPVRFDQDHVVTHHIQSSLEALSHAFSEAGLVVSSGPPPFWKRLSETAGQVLDNLLSNSQGLTEPFVASAVSRLLGSGAQLQSSSSMPIRDLDFFARPCVDAEKMPVHPPVANRGASGIDGVLSTAIGYCHGRKAPSTLVIGDVASLHDINALQQLSGPDAPPLTVVIVNNGGGGIFSFLPIAKHKDVMNPCFDEPHSTNFADVCAAFGVAHHLCETPQEFEAAYISAQRTGPRVIEAKVCLSHEENAALHKSIGQAVARAVQEHLLSQVQLAWRFVGDASTPQPIVLLLHGWLGEQADWAPVAKSLATSGHNVLAVDLPGHGASVVGSSGTPDAWEAAALFSLPAVVEALVKVTKRLRVPGALLVGYSLGGRVALTFAEKYPQLTLGVVALSANPGLQTVADCRERVEADDALAAKLARMEPGAAFSAFLSKWYQAPLWGQLSERRPLVYQDMFARREKGCAQFAAFALRGMSLGRQQSCWHLCRKSVPLWYGYGALDIKFAAIGEALAAEHQAEGSNANVRITAFADVGHALVEESPDEVGSLCKDAAEHVLNHSESSTKVPSMVARIVAAWAEPVELPLKAPLKLSRGEMSKRLGLLVVLQAEKPENVVVTAIGEISPLPQFHQESLEEAEAQLQVILASLQERQPELPLEVARLDGAIGAWLAQVVVPGVVLLPSVRAGLEMALLHLAGRVARAAHLGAAITGDGPPCCCVRVGINALVAREEDVNGPTNSVAIVKVKVGKDPVEDARNTNKIAELMCKRHGHRARLRLDANQAWSVEQAASFINGLSECAVSITEYLEEPVRWPELGGEAAFFTSWEELGDRTEQRVKFAVDESLVEKPVTLEQLSCCKAPIAALVLKPALQGLEKTRELAAWALSHNARAVLSSAFESGIALCHFTILAAALAPPPWLPIGGVTECHGFGTFARLAEDVLSPPFADLVVSADGYMSVDALACQEALDRTADLRAEARRGLLA